MAEHPSFTLACLLPVGGIAGYMRTRSAPSLIAGVGLGLSYAYAGYLIKENKDYGTELALGNSVVLLVSGVMRSIKTRARAPIPLALGATGLLASFYYQKKTSQISASNSIELYYILYPKCIVKVNLPLPHAARC
ncbi:TMEM14 family protein [Aspergillus niger CBS 101883]|uniref:Contig An15c0250, genomic contig n=2 Tax=Aspergillus niger TaxID=5061 RepID=A2R6F0_ASPNC|nr:uncharacterized protein BO96DRAFT_469879 [Aspergillus niger CBS 101883]XP_059602644.1 uncharacterized protein An15g07710 [Aspergillus niger]PYH51706.1 hypothetical protein BO96DRAFT_469879 [Aspergillus niger CBS 101883]CAK42658.1 unnamed protein product [Aspergillus niger]